MVGFRNFFNVDIPALTTAANTAQLRLLTESMNHASCPAPQAKQQQAAATGNANTGSNQRSGKGGNRGGRGRTRRGNRNNRGSGKNASSGNADNNASRKTDQNNNAKE